MANTDLSTSLGQSQFALNQASRLSGNKRQFVNKWTRLSPLESRLNPGTFQAVRGVDAMRVTRGSTPLSMNSTAKALLAANQRAMVTKPPDSSAKPWYERLFGGIAHDIEGIVEAPFTGDFYKGIWNQIREAGVLGGPIPAITGGRVKDPGQMLAHALHWDTNPEVKQGIAQMNAVARKAKEDLGYNPLRDIGAIASVAAAAPGGAMIPGVSTTSRLLPGGAPAGEIVDHPVLTALDVLPIAAKGAQLSSIGKAALSEAADAGTELTAAQARRLAMKSVLTKTFDEDGKLIPGRLGPSYDSFMETGPGQGIRKAYGGVMRKLSADETSMQRAAQAAIFEPNIHKIPWRIRRVPELMRVRDTVQMVQRGVKEFGVDEERVGPLSVIAERGNPFEIAQLPEHEQGLVNQWADLNASYGAIEEAAGMLHKINGEYVSPRDFKTYNVRANNYVRNVGKVQEQIMGDSGLADRLGAAVATMGAQEAEKYANFFDLYHQIGTANAPRTLYRDLYKEANNLSRNRITPGVRDIGAEEAASGVLRTDSWAKFTRNLRVAANAEKKFHSFDPMPTRFARPVGEKLRDTLVRAASPEDAEAVLHAFNERNYLNTVTLDAQDLQHIDDISNRLMSRNPGLSEERAAEMAESTVRKNKFDSYQTDAMSNWRELADAGADPIFMHRISPSDVASMKNPRFAGKVQIESQIKDRGLVPTGSTVENMQLALTHQGYEIMRNRVQTMHANDIVEAYGRPLGEIQDDIRERILRQHPELAGTVELGNKVREEIHKRFTKIDPQSQFGISTAQAKDLSFNPDTMMLPKVVGDGLKRLQQPVRSQLGATLDKATGMYRMSVTGLSLRTQLNNIAGNLFLTILENPRALRELPGVLKSTFDAPVEGAAAADLGRLAKRWNNAKLKMQAAGDLDKMVRDSLEKGGTADEIIQRIQESPAFDVFRGERHTLSQETQELLAIQGIKARQIIDNLPDVINVNGRRMAKWLKTSQRINEFFDDWNRSANFEAATKKALKEGMSPEAAAQVGLDSSRRVAMTWSMMTPFERDVMRRVIPFYGWMRHILTFATKYPLDHPLRTALIANLVGPEMEDRRNNVPAGLDKAMFLPGFLGGGKEGDRFRTAVNTSGLNPFDTVTSAAGIMGFLAGDLAQTGDAAGNLNPALKIILQGLGMDARTGTADLYPDLVYDPHTGQMTANTGNPWVNALAQFIPQAAQIPGLQTQKVRDMAAANPIAGRRALYSAFGLPQYLRRYEVPAEYAKQEIRNDRAQSQAFTDAVKSGDYSGLAAWPALLPMVQEIKKLQDRGLFPTGQAITPEQQRQLASGLRQAAAIRQMSQH